MVLALAAATVASAPIGAMQSQKFTLRADETKPLPSRRAKRSLASVPERKRRSRGPAAKPKRHRNRLTISRRVRRKHRRAA